MNGETAPSRGRCKSLNGASGNNTVSGVPAKGRCRSYTWPWRTRYKKRVLTHPDRKLSSLPPSMPLIIPNDHKYDVSTNELRPIPGERRSSLKIVPETLRLLESIERPVAVLAICGPYRTGKSYILSRMLDSADAFDLGHTMNPKTFGIWIGTTVLDCDEFTLLLVDTEGMAAVSATMKDDASVLVMTALLSSCLIYNSFSVPNHDDLQKMSHFAQLATSIVVNDVQGESEQDDCNKLRNHFPDFLWLLRDVTLIPTGEDGKEVPPTKYLKTKVLRRSSQFNESKSDQVARAILTVFPTIECKTIRPPSTEPTVMRNIATQQDRLDPRFNKQVQELVEYLLQHVRGKKGILSGKMVDGPILAAMATHYLEAVNKPGAIPCISDTWQAAIEARCKKVMEQLLLEYDHEIEAKVKELGLPMEEDSPNNSDLDKPRTLLALHRSILLEKSKALLKQVGHFVSRSATSGSGISKESLSTELELGAASFTEELTGHEVEGVQVTRKRVTGGILFKYAQENREASRSTCTQRFDQLYAAIEGKMNQPCYSFDDLTKDLEQLQIKYYHEAVGPAKWEVFEEKRAFIKSQEKFYKALQGFKKLAFDAQQQAADASAAAAKLQDSVQTIQTQTKEDEQLNKRKFEQLEADRKEEMEKFRKEQSERIENEHQKYKDFVNTQMKWMAETVKQNREQMEKQMQDMLDENQRQREADRVKYEKHLETERLNTERLVAKLKQDTEEVKQKIAEIKQELEAQRKSETERWEKAEAERQQEADRRQKAEAERQQEADRRQKAEAELQQEADRRQKAEAERQQEADRRQKAEAELQQEADRRQKAKAEAERQQEADRRQKAKAEAERQQEVERRLEAETEKRKRSRCWIS